jgi:hypothetical protein
LLGWGNECEGSNVFSGMCAQRCSGGMKGVVGTHSPGEITNVVAPLSAAACNAACSGCPGNILSRRPSSVAAFPLASIATRSSGCGSNRRCCSSRHVSRNITMEPVPWSEKRTRCGSRNPVRNLSLCHQCRPPAVGCVQLANLPNCKMHGCRNEDGANFQF